MSSEHIPNFTGRIFKVETIEEKELNKKLQEDYINGRQKEYPIGTGEVKVYKESWDEPELERRESL